MSNPAIVDRIATTCVEHAMTWPWVQDKLTPGMAQAWMLQHSMRNWLLSSKLRPAWASRCTDKAIVRKTIGQQMEELIFDKGLGYGHTKILREMAANIGITGDQLDAASAHPKVDIYFNVLENLCRNRHWIVGWLSTSLEEFVILDPRIKIISAKDWMADLGLTEEQVFFLTYHEVADLEHAGKKVWRPIKEHVTTPELEEDVMSGLQTALEAHKLFYEGVFELGQKLDTAGTTLESAAA